MITEAYKDIIKIIKKEYIRDNRYKTEILSILNQKAGPNLAALCKCVIDNLENNEKQSLSL